jgi:putative ABC transport system permease protein
MAVLHRARALAARARELFRSRARFTAQQDEEFAFHLDMETRENVRRGMTEADARRAALLRFGGVQRFREATSDARGVAALDNLARDARFSVRRLHRAPGFSAAVVATLGIGIGTAVGIGSIVHGVLLRDLPYEGAERLARVGFVTDGLPTPGDLHSDPTYYHLATSAQSFTALGAYSTSDAFALTDGDAPQRVTIASMTPNVFTLLGVRPLLGQLLEPGDTSFSNPRRAVLISENLWRRRYGADPSIIGREIGLDHGARVVVGVLPRSFDFPRSTVDVFYPAVVPVGRQQITARYTNVVGRLRDGVSTAAAEAEMNALLPGLTERFPAITRNLLETSRARVTVQPLKAATVATVRPQLVLLGVLVAVVLLIATTNVVNLFLLRTERASREIAIARSLGASRVAVARRFVVEGVVLGLVSAVVAVPTAAVALATKFGFTEREIPRLHEVSFSAQTVALAVGCAVLIGAAVGLLGLTRTSVAGLYDHLRSARATSSRAWRRAQDGLVAFQVAIALVLLVAAGLLGRSFLNLSDAAIGFAPDSTMTFHASLPWGSYRNYGENAGFHARVLDRFATLPGVTGVAAARSLPLANRGGAPLDLQLEAIDGSARPAVSTSSNMATPDYFQVMGIPLRSGRSFQAGDLRAPALVTSERLAQSLFGTTDAVGRRVRKLAPGGAAAGEFTIVGVVGDVHWARIEDGYAPMAYYPLLRDGDGLSADSVPVRAPREAHYVMRGSQLPSATMVQRTVAELDPRVPAASVRGLDALVSDATAHVRLTMLLIAFAGVAALVLGVIGVYGVVAYAAAGRIREFGIRLALGAAPRRVGGLVLTDGLKLLALGTVTGLVAALAGTRFLRGLLYEVRPTSVAEFGLATGLLVVVTVLAIALPAYRASRTHPAVVLRGE